MSDSIPKWPRIERSVGSSRFDPNQREHVDEASFGKHLLRFDDVVRAGHDKVSDGVG